MLNKDFDFLLGLLVGASLSSKQPLPYELSEAVEVMPSDFRPLVELIGKEKVTLKEVSDACWHAKIDYLKGHTILECVARQLTMKYMEDLRVVLLRKANYRMCDVDDREKLLKGAVDAELFREVVSKLSEDVIPLAKPIDENNEQHSKG